MGLFSKKKIECYIKRDWEQKTCSLQQLIQVLEKDDLLEIWVKLHDLYFQIGSSSDYSKNRGFFDKVYYINMETDRDLFKLLNSTDGNQHHFFMSSRPDEMMNAAIIQGSTLAEVWHNVIIVGVDSGDPKHYLAL